MNKTTRQVVNVSDAGGVRVGVMFNGNPTDIDFPIRKMDGSVVYKDKARLNTHTKQRLIAVMDSLYRQGQTAINDLKVRSVRLSYRVGVAQFSTAASSTEALIVEVQRAIEAAETHPDHSDYDHISIHLGAFTFTHKLKAAAKA